MRGWIVWEVRWSIALCMSAEFTLLGFDVREEGRGEGGEGGEGDGRGEGGLEGGNDLVLGLKASVDGLEIGLEVGDVDERTEGGERGERRRYGEGGGRGGRGGGWR